MDLRHKRSKPESPRHPSYNWVFWASCPCSSRIGPPCCQREETFAKKYGQHPSGLLQTKTVFKIHHTYYGQEVATLNRNFHLVRGIDLEQQVVVRLLLCNLGQRGIHVEHMWLLMPSESSCIHCNSK